MHMKEIDRSTTRGHHEAEDKHSLDLDLHVDVREAWVIKEKQSCAAVYVMIEEQAQSIKQGAAATGRRSRVDLRYIPFSSSTPAQRKKESSQPSSQKLSFSRGTNSHSE